MRNRNLVAFCGIPDRLLSSPRRTFPRIARHAPAAFRAIPGGSPSPAPLQTMKSVASCGMPGRSLFPTSLPLVEPAACCGMLVSQLIHPANHLRSNPWRTAGTAPRTAAVPIWGTHHGTACLPANDIMSGGPIGVADGALHRVARAGPRRFRRASSAASGSRTSRHHRALPLPPAPLRASASRPGACRSAQIGRREQGMSAPFDHDTSPSR